ncbi:MAG: bifunctional demethylmenaquinone methyltransferase/2-methoxy-6-polyprenyl-1,4-benzoquinol methylase UbiE [Syntrophales bacterium]|nr:bifunctional demethylmenaquinone methyltransferase/2-methoxy-6-polyprenyl-1,4-benzoquinol methylase UbiE [Syntrophales bacterium]
MATQFTKSYPSVKSLTREEHLGMVREIFSTIPSRYDMLNRILSLNRDVSWRLFAIRQMNFFRTHRLLDLATGTADIAIEAACLYPQIEVVGIDFVREMMDIGEQKVLRRNLAHRVRLLQADATALPLADNSFDVASIAFGIRNIPDRPKALAEMARVVVPGGMVLVLEMHYPEHHLWQVFYNIYLRAVLPFMARAFSKNPAAYDYLSDSIINFPNPPAFARLMGDAGLEGIRQYPLTFGTTYLHMGIKT